MTALGFNIRTIMPAGRISVWIVGLIGLILAVSSWRGLTAAVSESGVKTAVQGANTNLALASE